MTRHWLKIWIAWHVFSIACFAAGVAVAVRSDIYETPDCPCVDCECEECRCVYQSEPDQVPVDPVF